MKLSDIDPNFKLDTKIPETFVFRDVWETPCRIYGLADNGKGVFERLPLSLFPRLSQSLQNLSGRLAGACVRFSTDAEEMAVLWELKTGANMGHFAPCGISGMELFEETDHGTVQITNLIPVLEEGGRCRLCQNRYFKLPGGLRNYVLYLPLYNGLRSLVFGLPPEAVLGPGRTPRVEKPVVFYGSSVTEGGCASKAGSCHATILARRLDAALVNMGLSGNAKGEPEIAEYLATLDMSLFVYEYDYNAPTAEHLAATHEPFFRIIRKARPFVPVVMVSRTGGKQTADAERRREIILTTYRHALDAGDRNVYYIDGSTLFGEKDRDLCTVDGAHPTDIGFLRMADGMEPLLRKLLNR